MRVWLLPIEPLAERYSAQWLAWVPRDLRMAGADVRVVEGDTLTERIESGQFLDVHGTHVYKATQLARMMRHLHAGAVRDGDVVLLLDAWSPSVEALAYVRDLAGPRFGIAGLFHAGSYDPWDLLGQSPRVASWAQHVERGWLAALDLVFLATSYHRALLERTRGRGGVVTGFPLHAAEWREHARPWAERERLVVFPHRLAAEKQPGEFDRLREAYEARYPGDRVTWVRTKDVWTTKADYYAVLGRARVAFSAALQETWGIAMLEAASLGCHPVVPDRLSYVDTFPRWCRYTTPEDAVRMVHEALNQGEPHSYDGARWECAVSCMVDEMQAWARGAMMGGP